MKIILFLAALIALPAQAEDLGQFETTSISSLENTSVRGYYKRDRYFIFGSKISSLAQMHEIQGWRVGLGAQNRVDTTTIENSDLDYSANTIVGDASYGFQTAALGVVGALSDGELRSDATELNEDLSLTYAMPKVAVFLDTNWTLALGIELGTLKIKGTQNDLESNMTFDISRPSVGLSYHNAKLEAGISYQAELQDTTSIEDNNFGTAFTLAPLPSASERSIYAPAMLTSYIRGNITDSFSISSSVGYSFHDEEREGAIEIFEDYDNEDLLSGKLAATFWTQDRSRISLAAEYQGGATARDGVEELGLGNRMANLYGGSISGVYSFNKVAYLSLVGRLMRGELDEVDNGQLFKSKEDIRTVALSLGSKL